MHRSARKTIFLGNRKLTYELRRSIRSKHIRMTVSCDGRVAVSMPPFVPAFLADRFLREKAEWLFGKLDRLPSEPPLALPYGGNREYERHRARALAFVTERALHWNRIYGFEHGRISVRNQKTRWGSCSKQGNLSFNWRLLFLPPEMADYVVVHELCHLSRFDHSEEFWDLVTRTIPDHREIRKKMRRFRSDDSSLAASSETR